MMLRTSLAITLRKYIILVFRVAVFLIVARFMCC
jgi:hypothetical protein